MDDRTFDKITVWMASERSRRDLFRRFAGGIIGLAAINATTTDARAQACAGIQESCAERDCCEGYGCNEDNLCIAAAECAGLGGGCLAHEQCCQGYYCDETGTCIAGAECSGFATGCDVDDDCCGDLVCNADGLCFGPGRDAGDNGGGAATELPNTGVGHTDSPANWIAGLAAVAAGTAFISGKRLREQTEPVDS